MKIPSTILNQILICLFKDIDSIINHLKDIENEPAAFSDIKKREQKRKIGILIKKLKKLKQNDSKLV